MSKVYEITKSILTDWEAEIGCNEVVELINTCIHSAAKLINTIDHIEKEINN